MFIVQSHTRNKLYNQVCGQAWQQAGEFLKAKAQKKSQSQSPEEILGKPMGRQIP